MSQPTQTYKRSLSGSVGAGMGAVFNAKGRTYYILEHKVSSQYHRAGETQEIIVDQIEIGRSQKCQVRFDDSFRTVSHRHAAIVREGAQWKLVHLSQTNRTLLNGHAIQNEWYLQNGDEIQLSVNGPKLGFIVPSGNKSTVGSIGLSRRLSLFRQQALRPYKTAMAVLGTLLVLAIAGGTGGGIYLTNQNKDLVRDLSTTKAEIDILQAKNDSIIAEMEKREKQHQEEMIKQTKQIKSLNAFINSRKDTAKQVSPIIQPSSDQAIQQFQPYIYYVLVTNFVISNGHTSREIKGYGCHGTGFLLDDGRLVTARHVVQPWLYPTVDDEFLINKFLTTGEYTISYTIKLFSPEGKHMILNPSQVKVNTNSDYIIHSQGDTYTFVGDKNKDWAYFNTSIKGGLHYDNTLSQTLKVRTKLAIWGYPLDLGVDQSGVTPLYSEAIVARDGLEKGLIYTTATTYEHGNSGGPVFVTNQKGDMIVIGIVSLGKGRSTGGIVPIAAVGR